MKIAEKKVFKTLINTRDLHSKIKFTTRMLSSDDENRKSFYVSSWAVVTRTREEKFIYKLFRYSSSTSRAFTIYLILCIIYLVVSEKAEKSD